MKLEKPKQYSPDIFTLEMIEHPAGLYVTFEDYEKLALFSLNLVNKMILLQQKDAADAN